MDKIKFYIEIVQSDGAESVEGMLLFREDMEIGVRITQDFGSGSWSKIKQYDCSLSIDQIKTMFPEAFKDE